MHQNKNPHNPSKNNVTLTISIKPNASSTVPLPLDYRYKVEENNKTGNNTLKDWTSLDTKIFSINTDSGTLLNSVKVTVFVKAYVPGFEERFNNTINKTLNHNNL
jgi:hypothetical protein